MNMEKRALIRMKSLVSFAGKIVEVIMNNGKIEVYVLKPSEKSSLLIHIPVDEIDKVFFMSGEQIEGDEINV